MIEKEIIHLLITYRYAIITPIALIEGQLISLLVGILSRAKVLNPFLGGLCVIAGNLSGDIILYWLGYRKGEKFVARWGKYFSLTEERVSRVRSVFEHHSTKILLISKLTNGFGLASAVLFTAGTMKVPFSRYMFLNVVGECIWTSMLVCIGYFLGSIYMTVNNVFEKITIIAVVVVAIAIGFLYVKRRFMTHVIPSPNT